MDGEGLGYLSGLSLLCSLESVGYIFNNVGKSRHAEKCWIDLFMSQDRRPYFAFWIGKIPGNLLCWNMKLFPPCNPLLRSYIAHLYFIVSLACSNLKLVLLHCNHLPSHQLTWWKLQVKLQYMFLLIFVSRQKPSNECWKTTATCFTHKKKKKEKRNSESEHSKGKTGLLQIEFYMLIS